MGRVRTLPRITDELPESPEERGGGEGGRVLTESRKGATCEVFRTKWADRSAPRG